MVLALGVDVVDGGGPARARHASPHTSPFTALFTSHIPLDLPLPIFLSGCLNNSLSPVDISSMSSVKKSSGSRGGRAGFRVGEPKI